MRITFIVPQANLSGGVRVVGIYAQALTEMGHDVSVISPPPRKQGLRKRIEIYIKSGKWPVNNGRSASHFDGLTINHKVLEKWRPVTDEDVPDSDVVIATWWETAEWVHRLSPKKGAKVYFIQGYEVHSHIPQERSCATYRMPFHKITVSEWLLELMNKKYNDTVVDLVPNTVDFEKFYAPPRGKQKVPTVGLLYSPKKIKGVAISLAALCNVRKTFPDLSVISFGLTEPTKELPLPSYVQFHKSPPQDQLRKLYSACDVWLWGSRTEGFGLPPIEAMACRTPVVSTKVGALMGMIESGRNGELVEVDDIDGLANAVIRLLSLPEAAWIELSNNAFETVTGYTWKDAAFRFFGALDHACQRAEKGEISGKPISSRNDPRIFNCD